MAIDDPYYCGLRARIPAFVQKAMPGRKKAEAEKREREAAAMRNGHVIIANGYPPHPHPHPHMGPQRFPIPGHPMMWHAKSVDSGMGMQFKSILFMTLYFSLQLNTD